MHVDPVVLPGIVISQGSKVINQHTKSYREHIKQTYSRVLDQSVAIRRHVLDPAVRLLI